MRHQPPVLMGLALLLLACSQSEDASHSADAGARKNVATVSQGIQPSDTGAGIDSETRALDYHYVALPAQAAERRNVLVMFFGGSGSTPGSYTDLTDYAASLGYGAIDLRHPNKGATIGSYCYVDDACSTQFRGEIIFGANTAYAPGEPVYDIAYTSVTPANSIINRMVNVLDYLASQAASASNPDPAYWAQFLKTDSRSPYVTAHHGNAYPVWSKIIISGHSQGGGHAAFLAVRLPEPVRRCVMFSSPNDNAMGVSASWITQASRTPVDHYWGLRNINEGFLGSFVTNNWQNLSGVDSGGVGGSRYGSEVDIGDGSGAFERSQRLVISQPNGASVLDNHDSTALNGVYLPAVKAAWNYLFTAAGAD